MARKTKSARQKRRSSEGPMPQGGAGLLRFYQDVSIGFKLSPVTALVISGVFILVVILASVGAFNWLF